MLEEKVLVVTGGGTGIGEGIARAVAAHGANVVINYRHTDATALADELSRDGRGTAIAIQADITVAADRQRLLDAAVDTFGRLDVWVNNAGFEAGSSLLETTEDEYDQVVDVDLRSVFFATQLAAQQFVRQGDGGLIVNISSVHEDWPMPGNTAYCVAKGGVRMLTRTAGVELAEHGVRVVGVGPGAVETPINSDTLDDPETRADLVSRIPINRLAQPRDVGELVAFLASDAASYLNAATIFTDGGMMQRGSDL